MDDIVVDPAIAEAMGFSSFGGTKRRKFNHDAATIDADITKTHSSGANAAPLGSRSSPSHEFDPRKRSEDAHRPDSNQLMPPQTSQREFDLPKRHPKTEDWPATHRQEQVEKPIEDHNAEISSPTTAFPTGVPKGFFDKLTWKELEQFRKGVKDENGDVAYFLPSFIEDPWAKLEREAEGSGT
ncbi:hypothetical protein FKW77_004757 [Venturia effusa]|uniref:Uncharacterized protein n=1 Tax=Venturia effusa TaxID=50376 RepID=A0A517LRB3_9PEZI|nr:hypothetical protein FKW77_004757 [Venturia effusa]